MCFLKTEHHRVSNGVKCYKVLKKSTDCFLTACCEYKIPFDLGVTIKPAYSPLTKIAKTLLPQFLKKKLTARYLDKHLPVFNGEVVHAYSTYEKALRKCYSNDVVVECLIPEGEFYWKNKYYSEVVALSIVVVKVITENQ